jgi:WD40 repeat protein
MAALSLLTAMPPMGQKKGDWKTYQWNVDGVHACAFTPDSNAVACLYWYDRVSSDSPWKAVYTAHLAIWDFRSGVVQEKLKWEYNSNIQGDRWLLAPKYLEYSRDGRRLALFDGAAIHVLDTISYRESQRIAVDAPQETFQNDRWATEGFSLAPDGSRAAVATSSTIGANGGFVRVYDLTTGQVVREWRLRDGVRYVTGVALSDDGALVAASWLPIARSSRPEAFIPVGAENVRVMEVKSGEKVAGMNTRYVAGPVLFGPGETLLTGSINKDRDGYALDTIKVWDARTGRLLREIANPRAGVHYELDLSRDGRLLLGYTGTEKPVENFVLTDVQQFQLWDFASGQSTATSPPFGPTIPALHPRMQLSPDGKSIVVWWDNGFAKPVVYQVPPH